jgi:hypothetical protein
MELFPQLLSFKLPQWLIVLKLGKDQSTLFWFRCFLKLCFLLSFFGSLLNQKNLVGLLVKLPISVLCNSICSNFRQQFEVHHLKKSYPRLSLIQLLLVCKVMVLLPLFMASSIDAMQSTIEVS